MFLIALLVAVPASGASFDCAKARTKQEKLICSTPDLSKADDVMAAEYARARDAAAAWGPAELSNLKAEQLQWLTGRVGACPDAACIATAYRQRTADLRFYAAQASRSKSDPPEVTGNYESRIGTLKVLALGGGRIKFSVTASEHDYIAAADGEAPVTNNVAVFSDPAGSGCKITIRFTHVSATVEEGDDCSSYISEHVGISGVYRKDSNEQPKFEE